MGSGGNVAAMPTSEGVIPDDKFAQDGPQIAGQSEIADGQADPLQMPGIPRITFSDESQVFLWFCDQSTSGAFRPTAPPSSVVPSFGSASTPLFAGHVARAYTR